MRYFENFQVGDAFVLGSLKVTEEDIIKNSFQETLAAEA